MKRNIILLAAFLVLSNLSFLTVARPATVQGAVYSFNLNPPNTAADESGNVIRVTGAGVFDTGSDSVRATGSFTILDSAGAVTGRGIWRATDFGSFDSFGGPSPGFQGGVLDHCDPLCPRWCADNGCADGYHLRCERAARLHRR